MLLACNGSFSGLHGLYVSGILPTMKSQLSQLPLLVGSGRVNI
jgi:hypothetical protein